MLGHSCAAGIEFLDCYTEGSSPANASSWQDLEKRCILSISSRITLPLIESMPGMVMITESSPSMISVIENGIQPNLLWNWKKEFLEKASVVFDDICREENLKEKLSEERRKEKAVYAMKAGKLTMQMDWLKNYEAVKDTV